MKLYKQVCRFWIESSIGQGFCDGHPITEWIDEEDADKVFEELKSQYKCGIITREIDFVFVKVEED